ncbi:MAG: hypothetical protein V4532_14370 [Pseudomonadota bacterium]
MSAKPRPSLAQTSRLVARALGMSAQELTQGFRPAIWDDLPQLLSLRARVLGDVLTWDDRAYLTWRYRLGRADQGGGDCWVLCRHGELLGMIGTQDLVLRCEDLACKTLSLMDIMIEPELEGAGLGVWLNLAIQEQAEATLAIGSNPNSLGLVRRLFEVLPDRRTFVHPVRLGHSVHKRLPVPGLANAMALAAEHLLRLLRRGLLRPWARTVQVRPLDFDDEAMAALNAQMASGPLVHCERSSQQFNWRVDGNPKGGCVFWGAWSAGQLVGTLGARSMPVEGGLRALIVMDALVSLPEGRSALRALLWAVLEQAWRERADFVSMTSCRYDLEQELHRIGCRQHVDEFATMGWNCKDEQFRALVGARTDWTVSELHTDRI